MDKKIVKTGLFYASTLLMIVGTVLVVAGFKMLMHSGSETFLQVFNLLPAVLLLKFGSLLWFLGLCGTLGALDWRKYCLGVSRRLLMLCLIWLVIILLTMQRFMLRKVENYMSHLMDSYEVDIESKQIWDVTQQHLTCCGVHDFQEWSLVNITSVNVTIEGTTYGVPSSCCSSPNCESVYQSGCFDKMIEICHDRFASISCFMVLLILFELLSTIFMAWFSVYLRSGKRKVVVQFQHIPQQSVSKTEKKPYPADGSMNV